MRARVFQGVDPHAFQCCIFPVLSAGVRQPRPRSAALPAGMGRKGLPHYRLHGLSLPVRTT